MKDCYLVFDNFDDICQPSLERDVTYITCEDFIEHKDYLSYVSNNYNILNYDYYLDNIHRIKDLKGIFHIDNIFAILENSFSHPTGGFKNYYSFGVRNKFTHSLAFSSRSGGLYFNGFLLLRCNQFSTTGFKFLSFNRIKEGIRFSFILNMLLVHFVFNIDTGKLLKVYYSAYKCFTDKDIAHKFLILSKSSITCFNLTELHSFIAKCKLTGGSYNSYYIPVIGG